MPTMKSKASEAHKALLREKGWSYRAAAPVLGVHWVHLFRVLKGERQSIRLLAAIERLPNRPTTKSGA